VDAVGGTEGPVASRGCLAHIHTVFWFLSNLASNLIEATVPRYGYRMAVMAVVGVAIGALASAVGYVYFMLTIALLVHSLGCYVGKYRRLLEAPGWQRSKRCRRWF